MPNLSAEPDPTRSIGYARIILGGAGRLPPSSQFRIWREGYPTPNLGLRGWQVTEERLKPVAVETDGDDTVLIVSPAITRHLDVEPYVLAIPEAGIEAPIFWPDTIDIFDGPLPPALEPIEEPPEISQPTGPSALGKSEPVVPHTPPPEPVTPVDAEMSHRPVVDPPIGQPGGGSHTSVPSPAQPGRSKVPALVGGLALLLAAGAGGWWFMGRPEPAPPPPVTPPASPGPVASAPPAAAPTPAITPTPAATPPPAPRPWADGTDGLPVRDVASQAPDAAALYAVALRRQEAGRYDDALLLFEEAADRGHPQAMTALARMYDPNGFAAGHPFSAPDPRSAARYYQQAARAGDTAAEAPRAALHSTLESLSTAGNSSATSALREFWP